MAAGESLVRQDAPEDESGSLADGEIRLPVTTAAEALLATLQQRGVDYLLANAGTDFAPLIEGLRAGAIGRAARCPRRSPSRTRRRRSPWRTATGSPSAGRRRSWSTSMSGSPTR